MPTLPPMQWVSICTNGHKDTHILYTHFSWVKILTLKHWVLRKLQCNYILEYKWCHAKDQTKIKDILSVQGTPAIPLSFQSQKMAQLWAELFWSEFFKTFPPCLTSFPLAWVLGGSCQGELKGDVEPLSILRVAFLNLQMATYMPNIRYIVNSPLFMQMEGTEIADN